MQIIIKGKNVDLTEALRHYAMKKVEKLDRYFNNIQDVQVTLGIERGRSTAEATMLVAGAIIRAEEKDADMYSAIDRMSEKLEKQIKRYKTKRYEKVKAKGKEHVEVEALAEISEEQVTENIPRIVKTKRFALKPMDAEEAVEQMELLGHTFYVFLNSESNQINVVYKREDGDYGLIEPQMV